MIVRSGLDLPRLVRHVGPTLALLLAYDVVITVIVVVFQWNLLAIDALPLPLLGSAIALVVTLRNNAAYGRWWEARTLWGAVVNNSRSFAIGTAGLLDRVEVQTVLIRYQIAYALSLRCHLLRTAPWADIAPYIPAESEAVLRSVSNVPNGIHALMSRALGEARRRGELDSMGVTGLQRSLADLANAQGGLERIKNTPLPRQYNQLPQVFTSVYCLLLPLGLVHDLGIMTPVGSTVIGFMFLALDRVGRDLEDPFENTIHDIPMRAITRTIEIDLLHIGREPGDVPRPVQPENGILW